MPDDDNATDANGNLYSIGITSRAGRWQKIANSEFPQLDKDGTRHARNIREQPADRHVLVHVRLEFEHDGEAVIEGRAERWTSSHVYVVSDDPRLQVGGVWVRSHDVRRR